MTEIEILKSLIRREQRLSGQVAFEAFCKIRNAWRRMGMQLARTQEIHHNAIDGELQEPPEYDVEGLLEIDSI